MPVTLQFLGASRNVTGSCYLIDTGKRRVIVDCGLFQERKFQDRNWHPFPFDPSGLDAVLLTHAHLDHCGRLPLLARQGFRGPIHTTSASADIARIVLEDSGHIQEEDAAYKARRHRREGRRGPHPELPLYTREDASRTVPLFSKVDYGSELDLGEGLTASFHDAGHILGSAIIRLRVGTGMAARTILFSGDVGRWDKPIIRDPSVFDSTDYVLVESTYGDRRHESQGSIEEDLEEIVNRTCEAGGNLVIPSFAIERTHELLYHLNALLRARRIPPLMVFVDSPMAVGVTEVFRRHPELFDEEMTGLMARDESPFDFPTLHLVRRVEDSKAINAIQGSAIIISGSGMCTGGRIKHHLANNIGRPQSTILFVGYQAHGTLGRLIVEGRPEVRIFGKTHEVRARIAQIQGFSGHADRDELARWLGALGSPPRHVFVTHGDEDASTSFAAFIRDTFHWNVSIPDYLDTIPLE